jgi:Dimethlysulfonioproprionate lyase
MTKSALGLLSAPLGDAGSGRHRYGAAMTLFNAGLIDAAVLEVYRICANLDSEDPSAILAARGLPDPARPGTAPAPLPALAEALDRYLGTLSGPGVAEARAGLAAARATAPAPVAAGVPNAVVAAHLPAAIDALSQTHPALAAAIARAAPALAWVTYDLYPRALIGDAFATGHAYATLMGETSPYAATDFDLGLFLIAPGIVYRDHAHAAPELYVPMTGPHGWRFGPGTPVMQKPAHMPVWNDPHDPHLTQVGRVPFLALFCWTGNVNEPAYVLPADDWAELEAG